MPDVETLEQALRPHAIDRSEVARRYPGPSGLVRRILGVLPHAVSYFEIWPPALVTYNLMVPALLDVPKCDMGMGISPDLRALVAHAASRAFGCRYCTAHTAIMGTVIRGALKTPQISSRVFGVRDLDSLGSAGRIAVEYASAIGPLPSKLTDEHIAELQRVFRADHCEAIVLVAAVMGYLNRYMDALGTVLESAVLNSVDAPLGESDWDAGKHFDEALSQTDEEVARPSRLGLLREIPNAVGYEKDALTKVPKARAGQTALVREAIGFVPYYFDTISRDSARRILAHLWLERLATEGVDVTAGDKLVVGWIGAKAAGNDVLAAHFAFSAHRAGIDIASLAAAMQPPREPNASPRAAMQALAHAISGSAAAVPPPVIAAMMKHHSPASIIELLLVASATLALHRYTATITPAEYEPEIAAFVSTHREALGLSDLSG